MNSGEKSIGILCWEEGSSPRGLEQLESLVGNSVNPLSYDFPVVFRRVKGANIQTVLEDPDPKVLSRFIETGKAMISEGVKAITTSCGFNAIFQRELADGLDVPVFTSSLLQVTFVHRLLKRNQSIAIITAKMAALTTDHLTGAGVSSDIPIHVFGLEKCSEWNKIFTDPEKDLDLTTVEQEIVNVARTALGLNTDIGAFVLECTDLPPFSQNLRNVFGLPVFDFLTMTRYVYEAIA